MVYEGGYWLELKDGWRNPAPGGAACPGSEVGENAMGSGL